MADNEQAETSLLDQNSKWKEEEDSKLISKRQIPSTLKFPAGIPEILNEFQRSPSLALNNPHDDSRSSECNGKATGFEDNRTGLNQTPPSNC